VLVRLLAPSPADRYQSAREARAGLLGIAQIGRAPQTAVAPREPASPAGLRPLAPLPAALLEPGPRPLTGETRALMKRVVSNPLRLMSPSEKAAKGIDVASFLLIGFLSVVTVGILPMWFISIYLTRKRRARRYFAEGVPATARILDMDKRDIGWGEKLARVRYEFEADGRLHRGSDEVLPILAERWERGDTIQVLYLPDEDYDSLIISTS
jgi:hypothetical protein